MARVSIDGGGTWYLNGSGWQTGYKNSYADITISSVNGVVTITCSNLQTTSTGGDNAPWYAYIWYFLLDANGEKIGNYLVSSNHYFNNGASYHGAGQTYYTGNFSTSFSLSSHPTVAAVRAGYTFAISGYESYSGGEKDSSTTKASVGYTVTFNTQKGYPQPAKQLVSYNGYATRPTDNISRKGYTFKNWYTAASGGSVFNFNTPITSNIILYAQWDVITYNISYNLDGGSVSGNPTSYTVENDIIIPNPSKADYRFIGWSGSGIASGTYVKNLQWNAGSTIGNKSYVANWRSNVFVLSYDATQGTSAPPSQYCNENEFIVLQGEATWDEGYGSFRNWNDQPDGSGHSYNPGDSINMNDDKILYAMWNYRNRIHANGGSIIVIDSEIDSSGAVTRPGIIIPIDAEVFSSSSNYTVGDYCSYNNDNYVCHTAVDISQTGGAWTGSSNWTLISTIPPIDYDSFDSTKSYNPGDKIDVFDTNTQQWVPWVCVYATGPSSNPMLGPWQALNVTEHCVQDYVQLGKTYGGTLRIPFKFDRMGYTPLGLSHSIDATTATYPYITSPSNPDVHYVDYTANYPADIYMVWQAKTYTVTFKDGFSETGDIIKVISNIPYGGAVRQSDVPKPGNYYGDPYNKYFIHPEGYQFITWAGDYNNVTSDMTVVAQWDFCAIWVLEQVGQTKMWLPYKPHEGS